MLGSGQTLCIPSLSAEAARPAVPYVEMRQYIDQSIRELAAAPPKQQAQLVLRMNSVLKTKPADGSKMLSQFAYTIVHKPNGVEEWLPRSDRMAVLRKVIPALIAQLDGPQAVAESAYWMLISLQAHCPEPKREVWERWWQNEGSRLFDDMAK